MITTITVHAAERYIERYAPHLTLDEAKAELSAFAEEAVRLREKTDRGHAVWQAGEVFFVTKFDGGERVVVTVLPPGSRRAIDVLGDAALLAESEADRAEMQALIAAEKAKAAPEPVESSPLFQITVLTKKNLSALAKRQQHKLTAMSTADAMALATERAKRAEILADVQKVAIAEKSKRLRERDEANMKLLASSLRVAVRLLLTGEGDLKDIAEDFLAPKFWRKK